MPLVISKSRLWPKIAYSPNQAQRLIHGSPARYRVVSAGRRTGKSTAGGNELLPEAFRAYCDRTFLEENDIRREFWIVGPEYSDSEKEFRRLYTGAKKLQMPFDKPGTYYDERGGDMVLSLWGGRYLVKAQSAKYPSHLAGEGLSGVILAEAAKLKPLIWERDLRPTLADFRGWALFTSTPRGRNWFYDKWTLGQHGPGGEWASFRFPSWMNEMLFPLGREDPEILSLCTDLSEEMIKQEIEAQFSEFVGQVFKTWDEEWHVRTTAEYHPGWPVFLATDYGWTNPTVVLFIQVDPWDRVRVIDEYYQTHRSPEEVAADLLEGVQSTAHPDLCRVATLLYPDPADPAASHTLAEKLRVRVMANTGGEQKTRLELIRKWLKDENTHLPLTHEDRIPKLTVNPRCKNGLREMDAYRYPETKNEAERNGSEKPMDKDDHWPEALGRFFAGHYGPGAVQAPARVGRVRYRRGAR